MLQEQKMEKYVFEQSAPTNVFFTYLMIDSRILQILLLARDFEIPKENFEKILQLLKENDRKKEFENMYKMEFAWDVKHLDEVAEYGKITSLWYD